MDGVKHLLHHRSRDWLGLLLDGCGHSLRFLCRRSEDNLGALQRGRGDGLRLLHQGCGNSLGGIQVSDRCTDQQRSRYSAKPKDTEDGLRSLPLTGRRLWSDRFGIAFCFSGHGVWLSLWWPPGPGLIG
jgi:hypothetical protein